MFLKTFYFIIIVLLLKKCELFQHEHRPVSENLRKRLDSEEHNSYCCAHKLKCCKRETAQNSPVFEIKSILTDCPKTRCNYSSEQIIRHKNATFQNLTDCIQKLLLTVKMTTEGVPCEKSQYIIIDHITDVKTAKKMRILNPYAIRIRQEPIIEVYGLTFERAVNAEAKEKVYNKHKRNYRGCNLNVDDPTCGLVKHDGKVIPYSTGFCCSCNSEKNRLMEESQVQWPTEIVPDYNKNRLSEDDYNKHYGFTGSENKLVYGWAQKPADKSVNYLQYNNANDGKPFVRQKRGGQECSDDTLADLPESFHESAHCLSFSNLWYSVFKLEPPQLSHKVRIQIFQKYEDCHGKTHWMDITRGNVIKLGNAFPFYSSKEANVIARYSAKDSDACFDPLDYKKSKILIPEKKLADPEQFLVVPKRFVSLDGKTCNSAGVGYEAFYKQKKRCSQPEGSCLDNQPQHWHDDDTQAESEGKSGKYFLKFYGSLSDEPVSYNASGQIQNIKLLYTNTYTSILYFELNADLITLLEPNSYATIPEVYADATNDKKTRITVKVINSGLVYGVYYVRLSGCPMDVPASFNNIASKSVMIPPQHQHIYNLLIEYPLSLDEFYCSVHVHNVNQELIAARKIRIKSNDRCVCVWHCKCACYITDGGLKCSPLSIDSYHDAGYQGGLPVPVSLVETSYLDELLAMIFHMFIIFVFTLFVMGMVKALLGLCCPEIGCWGLRTILGYEETCNEDDCRCKDEGISVPAQFCLNTIFFFIYPLALINIGIKKLCFSRYIEDECSCEQRVIDYECDDSSCIMKHRRCSSTDNTNTTSTKGLSNISLNYTTDESDKNE